MRFESFVPVQFQAVNSGTIQSQGYGVNLNGAAAVNLTNTGTIYGAEMGNSNEYHDGSSLILGTGALQLTNSGDIFGTTHGVKTGSGADIIINRGTIHGDVWLVGGADIHDGTGAGAASLVADLQATAVLGITDFLIY